MTDKIVAREIHLHGSQWGSLYGGYFGDKQTARDYVDAIMRTARACKPSAIVDLGGGTGFILAELIAGGIAENIRLVNMDESGAQLAACVHPRIKLMEGALQSFRREKIVGANESLMLVCRSVLQYGGISRQRPWLRHLRGELKPGEWFVHQSGCPNDVEAALALDVLFEMMGVEKWAPHRDAFIRLLEEAKFEIAEDFPMPPIEMPSDLLAKRYGISPEILEKIKLDLLKTCAGRPDLFKPTPSGFTFNFPYRVFACKAV